MAYLKQHHEQTEDELANAVAKAPKGTHQGGFDVAPANCEGCEGLHTPRNMRAGMPSEHSGGDAACSKSTLPNAHKLLSEIFRYKEGASEASTPPLSAVIGRLFGSCNTYR